MSGDHRQVVPNEGIVCATKRIAWFLVFALVTPLVFSQNSTLHSVTLPDLNVTDGSIKASDGRLLVDTPEMRAVLKARTPQLMEVHLTYLGATANTSRLANGDLRRQFGLKLKAQDACNLLYVMWWIEPKPNLAVSMKFNPGLQSSWQCGDRGYQSLKATKWGHLPELHPGHSYVLRAEINKQDLQITIDGRLMWEGPIPSEAMALDGPVGLRSDNTRVQFDLLVSR